uniref:Peptidase A2 domain-containing protein n=1 Tax=Trichuris muris TaxID=70415 RepID=A0A5S6QNC8_TRIMR
MFGQQRSLFNARYQCLKLTKNARDDLITYGGIVNLKCQRFQLSTLTEDHFKCLIFVCGLQSPNDAAMRLKLLNKIETETEVTVAKLVEECNRPRNLKHDIEMVQQSGGTDTLEIDAVSAKRSQKRSNVSLMHPDRAKVHEPLHMGRKEEFCPLDRTSSSSKQKANYRQQYQSRGSKSAPRISYTYKLASVRSVSNYRRYVTVDVMNKPITFQNDTGSDLTIISSQAWK